MSHFAIAALLLATTACAVNDDGEVPDPGQDPSTEPTPEPEVPLTTATAYQLTSELDVQASVALPQTVYDGVDLLRGLRDAPGETLFDLAEQAGVPAVEEVSDALPASLESRLYGWIDGYLQQVTIGDGTVAVVIDGIVDASETVLAACTLTSELTLDGGVATHTLTTIGFDTPGASLAYDLAALPSAIVEDTAAYTVAGVGDATTLTIGEHTFGLPYGELALRAVEDTLIAQRGTDLRGTLGALIDCPAVAAHVAAQCMWGYCVGHAAELTEICEGGLDKAAEEIRARFAAARFDAIALHTGAAAMIDADADGGAERLSEGLWTAELNAGMGPRPAPATFASN